MCGNCAYILTNVLQCTLHNIHTEKINMLLKGKKSHMFLDGCRIDRCSVIMAGGKCYKYRRVELDEGSGVIYDIDGMVVGL